MAGILQISMPFNKTLHVCPICGATSQHEELMNICRNAPEPDSPAIEIGAEVWTQKNGITTGWSVTDFFYAKPKNFYHVTNCQAPIF